jgi:hypothetical protein
LQAKGKNNFSSDLIELCQQTLSWQVDYCRGSTGQRMIRGLRLRTEGDTDPTLEDRLTTDNSDNPSDNLEPLLNMNSDNPDNLTNQNFFPKDSSSFTSHQITSRFTVALLGDDAKTEKVLPQEVVSFPETSINQASQVVSPVVSPVVSELSEIDYESYPHLTCNSIEGKRNQAQKIKRQLLQAKSREELTAIKQEESARFHWVWRNLLTDAERGKLKAIANTNQLNFLDLAQGESMAVADEVRSLINNLIEAAQFDCLAEVVVSFALAKWWPALEQQVLEGLPESLKAAVQDVINNKNSALG